MTHRGEETGSFGFGREGSRKERKGTGEFKSQDENKVLTQWKMLDAHRDWISAAFLNNWLPLSKKIKSLNVQTVTSTRLLPFKTSSKREKDDPDPNHSIAQITIKHEEINDLHSGCFSNFSPTGEPTWLQGATIGGKLHLDCEEAGLTQNDGDPHFGTHRSRFWDV